MYKNLRGEEFGNLCSYFAEGDFLQFSNVRIYAGGKVFSLQNHPTKLSPSFKYGIKINKENNSLSKTRIELCVLSGEQYEMKSILQSEFDTSSYKDVLFSECGEYVMYNDGNETTVMNIHSGQVHSFGSMSYIKHINGTRPLFETPSSLQPRLIHPYTRQYIDSKSMPEYQFVSPDGKLYADTRLNEYIEYYDKLLLATGSSAIIPNIEGVNENGIFTLKNVEDTYKIEEYIETHKVKNAAIIGGGFIGLEVAENFSKKNINVSILDKAHQLLTNIDADLIPFVHIELLKHDVSIELNKEIVKFDGKGPHPKTQIVTLKTVMELHPFMEDIEYKIEMN